MTIGDRCNFGPNVTIVTPMHPIIAEERRVLKTKDGREIRVATQNPSPSATIAGSAQTSSYARV